MSKITPQQKFFPRWEMPSDPVKAVWWFTHWLLKVLVRFFWLPVIVMVAYEVIVNARVGSVGDALVYGVFTLVIGLGVWAVLYVILQLANLWMKLSRIMADANQVQHTMFDTFSSPYPYDDRGNRVVEGSISEIKHDEQKK